MTFSPAVRRSYQLYLLLQAIRCTSCVPVDSLRLCCRQIIVIQNWKKGRSTDSIFKFLQSSCHFNILF